MKKTHRLPVWMRLASASLVLLFAFVFPVQAANECQVYYSYKNSSGNISGQTINLDDGETLSVNNNSIQIIQNKENYPVRVEITALGPIPNQKKWVTLNNSGDQDPPFSVYPAPVTLYQIECGGEAFGSTDALISALQAAGASVVTIAQGLVSSFGQTGAQVADLLKDAGFDATEVADALNEVFNTNGQQVASWLSSAGYWARYNAVALEEVFNANGSQVASWLRQAGYNVSQVTQGLIEAFGASAQQAATWLDDSGFSIDQIAQALKDKYNATAEVFINALSYEVCGVAGCPSDTSRRMIEALRDRFNQSAAQAFGLLQDAGFSALTIAQGLSEVYNTGAQQLATWMQQGGYALSEVATCLRQVYNMNVSAAADLLGGLYNATAETLQEALEAAGYAASQINQWLANQMSIESVIGGYTQGYAGQPIRTPRQVFPLRPGRNLVTLRGAALVGTSSIVGLPRGTRTRIIDRGTGNNGQFAYWTYLHVQIDLPRTVREGTRGTATLRLGQSNGPRFGWIVEAAPAPGGGRVPPPSTGGGGTARPDLIAMNTQNELYIVGSANTLDADGDFFTALDPFNNSAHCQGVPDGAVNRNNQQTSNTRVITVPDIRWGVENTSRVDITTPFTIELWRGNQRVDSQQINSLASRSQAQFTFRRPQSRTTVAKVGLGGGCYHAGQSREGWNDNPGFTVRIDTNDDIDESRENNNARNL